MATTETPGTAAVHGRLWGARAQDWADIQEGKHRPDYEAVFARLGLTTEALYCDAKALGITIPQSLLQRGRGDSVMDRSEWFAAVA